MKTVTLRLTGGKTRNLKAEHIGTILHRSIVQRIRETQEYSLYRKEDDSLLLYVCYEGAIPGQLEGELFFFPSPTQMFAHFAQHQYSPELVESLVAKLISSHTEGAA